jgi:hypothetical protein
MRLILLIVAGFLAIVLLAPRCRAGDPQVRVGGVVVQGCPAPPGYASQASK